ncbi:hypothetical protein, partial [Helicobacter sp. 13S00477-4]|uniref:beta strand repeat-containing protein n=1 Tax=Helicobacter sp. 13S00477-4 TaxID=1905759 RepID=UPI00117B9B2A
MDMNKKDLKENSYSTKTLCSAASIILSAFLFPFSGELQADTIMSATEVERSPKLDYTGGDITSENPGDTKNYDLNDQTVNGKVLNITSNLSVNFNNNSQLNGDIITRHGRVGYNVVATTTVKFDNSSMLGNIKNIPFPGARTTLSTTVSFSGTNASNDYAFKGNIENSMGIMNVSFSNDANMIGDIILGQSTDADKPTILDLKLNTGSLTGDVNLNFNSDYNSTLKASLGFVNNHSSDGYAWKGDLNTSLKGEKSDIKISFDSEAKWLGNANIQSGIFSIKFANKSTMEGNLNLKGGKSTIDFNNSLFAGNAVFEGGDTTLNLANTGNMKGNIGITGGKANIFVGFRSLIEGNIVSQGGNTTLKLKNNGTIKGDIVVKGGELALETDNTVFGGSIAVTTGKFTITANDTIMSGSINLLGDQNTFSLINSNIKSGIYLMGSSSATINLSKKSNINQISGVGKVDVTIDGSSVGSIVNENVNSIITFANTDNIDSLTINSIEGFKGKINGTIQNTTIDSMTGDNVWTLAVSNSTLKNIVNTNVSSSLTLGENVKIDDLAFSGVLKGTLKNSTFGDILNTNANSDLVIENTAPSSDEGSDETTPIVTDTYRENGNLVYAGKLSGTVHQTTFKSMTLSGTGTDFYLKSKSQIENLSITSGKSTINLDNSSVAGNIVINGKDTEGTLNLDNGAELIKLIYLKEGTININAKNQSSLGTLSVDGGVAKINASASILQGGVLTTTGNTNINLIADSQIKEGILTKGGNATITLSASKIVGTIVTSGGSMAMKVQDKSQITDKVLTQAGNTNIDIIESSLDGNIYTIGGTSNITIQNAIFSGNEIQTQGGVSNVAFSSDVSKISLTDDILPETGILGYLQKSNISAYSGNVFTVGGVNNVDFKDSIYIGGSINTIDGVSNVTLSFSDAFVQKLKESEVTKAFLTSGSGPEFNILTSGGTANIALTGSFKGMANINYQGGVTNLVFADRVSAGDALSGDALEESYSINPVFKSSDALAPIVYSTTINGQTYEDGVLVSLDGLKANTLLSPYRKFFKTNTAKISVDKITNPDIYTATITGIVVGEVHSLATTSPITLAEGDTPIIPKSYEAIFNTDSVFIGKLNITDRNVSVKLAQGSKLVLENGSKIATLSSSDNFVLNSQNIQGDTLLQTNTIIDLATGGMPSIGGNIKESFSTLTIDNIKDVNNAIFRISYSPTVSIDLPNTEKADHIIINATTNTVNYAPLSNYLQAYQNVSSPILGDLSDKNILVASVKNNNGGVAGLNFNEVSVVEQGYDVITTVFEKRVESTSGVTPPGESTTPTADESWTNYYIKSANGVVGDKSKSLTQSAISSNYAIFLSNINDLNKRLGELRTNQKAQGGW